jgi:hypothetical protein
MQVILGKPAIIAMMAVFILHKFPASGGRSA